MDAAQTCVGDLPMNDEIEHIPEPTLCAIIPAANLQSANAALAAAGFGPGNFSVASFTGAIATHAALHAWGDPAFSAAVKAIAGVVWQEQA